MSILRVVKKELRITYTSEVETAAGIEAFFDSPKEKVQINIYTSSLSGLVVQEPGDERVYLMEKGVKIRVAPEERYYCRWHNGPLDRRDDVLSRRYCTVTSDTKAGYCIKHVKTYRALYERCVGTSGEQALDACKRVEEKIPVPMGIYLVDKGGDKVKTGISRSWRLEDRISEQPHVVAVIVSRGLGLLEARELEIKLAQHPYIQQIVKSPDPPSILSIKTENRVPFLYGIVKNLGLKVKPDYMAVRPEDASEWMDAKYPKSFDETYYLVDAWGGYLLLEKEGKHYWIPTRLLQHKNSIYQVT